MNRILMFKRFLQMCYSGRYVGVAFGSPISALAQNAGGVAVTGRQS